MAKTRFNNVRWKKSSNVQLHFLSDIFEQHHYFPNIMLPIIKSCLKHFSILQINEICLQTDIYIGNINFKRKCHPTCLYLAWVRHYTELITIQFFQIFRIQCISLLIDSKPGNCNNTWCTILISEYCTFPRKAIISPLQDRRSVFSLKLFNYFYQIYLIS